MFDATSTFTAPDGAVLSYREIGDGYPLILLHGFTATGRLWVDHGPAKMLAQNGFRVILPDMRGHGASARPTSAPPDALADDGLALIATLGLTRFALGGYSLGARIAVRMLVRGARPIRAVVAGQGLEQIGGSRGERYRPALSALVAGRAVADEAADGRLVEWIARSGNDPRALLAVLDTLVPTPNDDLRTLTTETLVLMGADDPRRTSGRALAEALGNARYLEVPGDHGTAISTPAFAAAVLGFLESDPDRAVTVE